LTAHETASVRTCEEIADAIRALTPAQWARLRKVADRYSYAMAAEDLLQEAFRRALEADGRKCPVEVDPVRFLAEAMHSIANGELEKTKSRPALVLIASSADQEDGHEDPADSALSAEEHLAQEQAATAIRGEVLALFDDDPVAHDIVEGRMEDLSADELRELTGLDQKAYDSKLRLIRRRISNKYPKGWRS
jgi:DNA-directed RNA polymerase specialized sigma24 family protein